MDRIDSFRGDYYFLSNFYPFVVIGKDGMAFPSTEHAYQACKATTKEDAEIIRTAPTAAVAKKIGRRIKKRDDFERLKISVMLRILRKKFAPGTDLAEKLLNTGDAELIECNDWGDVFWGQVDGKGCNFLGKILMHIRQELQIGGESEEDFQ